MMYVFENMRKLAFSPDVEQASLVKRLGLDIEGIKRISSNTNTDLMQSLYISILERVKELRMLVDANKITQEEYQSTLQKLFESVGVSSMSNFARAFQDQDIDGVKKRFEEFSSLQMGISKNYQDMTIKLNRYWEQIKQIMFVNVQYMYEQLAPTITYYSKAINEYLKNNSATVKSFFGTIGYIAKTSLKVFEILVRGVFSNFQETMQTIYSYLSVFIPYLGRLIFSLSKPIYTDIIILIGQFLKAVGGLATDHAKMMPMKFWHVAKKQVLVVMHELTILLFDSFVKLFNKLSFVFRRIPGLAGLVNTVEKELNDHKESIKKMFTLSIGGTLDAMDKEMERKQKDSMQKAIRNFEISINELNKTAQKNTKDQNWKKAWEEIQLESSQMMEEMKAVSKTSTTGKQLYAAIEELTAHLKAIKNKVFQGNGEKSSAKSEIEETRKLLSKIDSTIKIAQENIKKTNLQEITGKTDQQLATEIGEEQRRQRLAQYKTPIFSHPQENFSLDFAEKQQKKSVEVVKLGMQEISSMREMQNKKEIADLQLKHKQELLEMSRQNYSKVELEKAYQGMRAIEEKKAKELSLQLEKEKQQELLRIKSELFGKTEDPFNFEGIKLRNDLEIKQLEAKRDEDLKKLRELGVNQLEYEKIKMKYGDMIAEQSGKLTEKIVLGIAKFSETTFGSLANTIDKLYELTGKRYKSLFYVGKAFAITKSIINTALGVTEAIGQGGIAGIITGAIVAAEGAIQTATIMQQTFNPPEGFARGGFVTSGTTSVADDVPALLSKGEAVLPKDIVDFYGKTKIKAIINREVPRDFFMKKIPVDGYAMGGIVGIDSNEPVKGKNKPEQPINITNIVDPSMFQQFLATTQGRDSILNLISNNSSRFRTVLSV